MYRTIIQFFSLAVPLLTLLGTVSGNSKLPAKTNASVNSLIESKASDNNTSTYYTYFKDGNEDSKNGNSGNGNGNSGSSNGSSSGGNTYYVRVTGSDSNNGLSNSHAFKTIKQAALVAGSGDTVYVGAGTYTNTTYVTFTKSGTSSNPCSYIADTTGKYTGDSGSVIIQAPKALGTSWTWQLSNVTDYVFNGFTFIEDPTANVAIYKATGSSDYNTYYNNSNWSTTYNLSHGVYVGHSDRVSFTNCKFTNHYIALYFEYTNNCTVTGSTFTDGRYMSIYSNCSKVLTLSSNTFSWGSQNTTHNYGYQVYSWASSAVISNCAFDTQGIYNYVKTLSTNDANYGYKTRSITMVSQQGMGYDSSAYNTYATNYNASSGTLSLDTCTFRYATSYGINTTWNTAVSITNSSMYNCLYGIYAYNQQFTIDKNTIEQSTDSLWNKGWSYGVYANVYNSPNNLDNTKNAYYTTWIKTGTIGGSITNSSIKNCSYGLLIASADVTLKTLSIIGNTDWAYSSSTGQWSGNNYTYGIYCYDNANKLTFSNDQSLTLSGHWITYSLYNTNTTLTSLAITGSYAGVYASGGTVDFESTTISNCGYYGAFLSSCTSVKAVNSSFSDNCKSNNWNWGWGLYYQADKTPRTAYTTGNTSWNSYLETYVYGTGKGAVTLQNCTFSRNGVTNNYGAGGLYLGSMDKTKIVLSGNTVQDNAYYGAYLFDSEWTLKNNAEFTSLTGNLYGFMFSGYRDTTNEALPYRTSKATISGYDISKCQIGVYASDSYLTMSNSNLHDNTYYGILGVNGHMSLTNVTATKNTYGVYAAYNITNEFHNCNINSNSEVGIMLYIYTSWYGVDRPYTYVVDGLTANTNGYCGLYSYAIKIDKNGYWVPQDGLRYSITNTTCNNNTYYGMLLYYGWLSSTPNLNVTCNNNGIDSGWGMGIYVEQPGSDINLTKDCGITVSNNSWGGIYVSDFNWNYNYDTQKYALVGGTHDINITDYTLAANGYYGVYSYMPRNVTVSNSTIQGGLYFSEPQGAINLLNSQFTGCYYGFMTDWGYSQYYNDLASGKVQDDWWNNYVTIPIAFHKPTAYNVTGCKFTSNILGGLYTSWWYNWDNVDYDKYNRVNVALSNTQFLNNGYRAFESYNNNVTADNCIFTGNGYSAILVWDGSTSLTNSTVDKNCFGRWNGTAYGPWDGDKWDGTACEISHSYQDGRIWNHIITNTTFNNNEGNALYAYDLNGGKVNITNCQANYNSATGMYLQYLDATMSKCQMNNNGTANAAGTGLYALYNNLTMTGCSANSNTGWGVYTEGTSEVNSADNFTYGTNQYKATIDTCTANNNYQGGIRSFYNSATISNTQATNNAPPTTSSLSGIGIQIGGDDYAQTYQHSLSNCSISGGWLSLYAYNTRATVQNCTVDYGRYGGYQHDSMPGRSLAYSTVLNSTFNSNGSFGLQFYNTSANIQSVQCNGNGKDSSGKATGFNGYGMLFTNDWSSQINNCTQTISSCQMNNNANYGLFSIYQKNQILERSTLNNNGDWGYYLTGPGTIKNNIIANNQNGAFLSDAITSGIEFWNNTVTNNHLVGVRLYDGSIECRNNIITNSQWGYHVDGASVVNSNNLINGNTVADYWHPTKKPDQLKGDGDVNKPPRFVDSANSDFRLAKGSPAINSGFSAKGIVDVDLLGTSRPMYKMHEIGAYEYTDPSGSLRIMSWNEQR